MIDKKLVEKNKKRLLQEKQRLEALLTRIVKDEHPEFGTKDDENAAEVTAYETNLVEERDLKDKLQKVDAALRRIKQGTYGVCVNGGEELPVARLDAVPEAENCVVHEQA